MSRQVADDATPIRNTEQLLQYFLEGAKPRSQWGLGLEYERIGVFSDSGETLPYGDGKGEGERSVRAVLSELARRPGWTAGYEGEHLVELQHDTAAVSLEPGAQLEFAGSVHRELSALREELDRFLVEVKRISEPMGITWLALGLNPFTPVERIGWTPKARYRVMSERLGRRGRLAHHMMKATAGIQGNYDYGSEQDAMRKFRLAMGVTSISTAMFANSPLYVGKPNGFQSMRAFIWLDTDPDRCGLLELAFHPDAGFRSYLDYALSVPLLFIVRDGRWIDMESYTFRRYLDEGRGEWRATVSDWVLHLTTLFPEVRLKRYLEVRGADSVDSQLAVAMMAWWKGLLYADQASEQAWRLIADWTWAERQQLHRDVLTRGLDAEVRGAPLRALARDLMALAALGLKELRDAGEAPDETAHLDPLRELVESPECSPARRLLCGWNGAWRGDRARLVEFAGGPRVRCQ